MLLTADGSGGTTWTSPNLSFTGVLPVPNGGTGVSSVTSGSYLVGNGTAALLEKTPAQVKTDLVLTKSDVGLGNVENVALSTWNGSANLTTLGTVTTGVWNGTAVPVANGGTGATTAAAARTNLGLGTAATLNAGTAANNLVQLDGSAKLPAVDGSQLTNISPGLDFADFFALMPGDNAATIAVGADVLFPQNGPASGAIARTDLSTFGLPAIGIYQVNFQVSVTEAGQLMLTLNGANLAYTVVGRATGTSQIVGTCLVTTTVINSSLTVRNPAGNSTALTITPVAGGTRPVSAHLVIVRLK
jgi:hypothetical protein